MVNKYWQYWKLKSNPKGRQCWVFIPPAPSQGRENEDGVNFLSEMQKAFAFNKKENPNSADRVYRANQQNTVRNTTGPSSDKVSEARKKAVDYYQSLQSESGFWPGDYGGPHFLAPGLIIASYVTESPLPAPHRALIMQYFLNHQNDDGGWGLHIEDRSTMFGTVLQYVALRLLGMSADDEPILRAKNWILKNGGAVGIPSWGKFYLSVLGVYEWEGCNSLFPEMWLLPDALPFHPSNYWCHARMVYLPMAYCFGLKVKAKVTPLIQQIRNEIYTENYEDINWKRARNQCASADLYHKPSAFLKLLNSVTNSYERIRIPFLRKKAVRFILDYINAEDEQTNFIDIGPVNQVINSICIWHTSGNNSEKFKKHYERWFDYLWIAEDGMKMNGYNGSQLWDTVFAVQAIMEGPIPEIGNPGIKDTLSKAYRFIDESQIKEEVTDSKKFHRHPSVGGWPFSTNEHGWPITDCTAEGLKVSIRLANLSRQVKGQAPSSIAEAIPLKRLEQACELILSLQNKDGGWASYELSRAPRWLELLNPSEIFGNIMIDYSYTECTSACIQALAELKLQYPGYRSAELSKSISKGIDFILSQQNGDGSWYGSWAVCFTYGTWFAIEALKNANCLLEPADLKIQGAINRGCQFLLSNQNPDGGWGESFESCLKKKYIPGKSSQIVNTSWALLSLMTADYPEKAVIDKGINYLVSRQLESGDFPQENIRGVFNHSCGISYTSYRNVFPMWSLGRYMKKYGRNASPKQKNGETKISEMEVPQSHFR